MHVNIYIYIYIILMWASEYARACMYIYNILSRVGGVRVIKLTGSSSDDWIYWHFGYDLS
jgi:hypothetical protein